MSTELIYKTQSPEAIQWWRDGSAKREADRLARRDYETKMTEEFGLPDRPEHDDGQRTHRGLWLRGDRVIGLDSGYSEQPPADSGWRLDSKDHIWMPKLATKQGKARAAELAALCTYDIRRHLDEVGIASMAFADSHLYRPGVEFDEDETALYVTWGSGRCAAEAEAAQAKVPAIVWTEVKRSVWYAREEAKAEADA